MRNAATDNKTQRVIDLSTEQLTALIDERLAEFLSSPPTASPPGPLDRAGAAQYLRISLAKLDSLCRRPERPLPFRRCGDTKRFWPDELRAWLDGEEVAQ